MSRTYRNKNTVPKGITVPDGKPFIAFDTEGHLYIMSSETERIIRYKSYYGRFRKNPLEHWKKAFLKNKKIPREYRYLKRWRKNPYSKEKKEYRKRSNKRYRLQCKNLIKKERWDEIPPIKGTCGWYTW